MTEPFRPSAACCSTPAIIGEPSSHQGSFIKVDSMQIYASGPKDSSKAIFIIYDVFGFSSQILEGADMLAAQGYRVFMPGFFGKSPAPLSWMPLDGPEQEDKLDEFCEGPGNTGETLTKTEHLRQELQELEPSIRKWGLIGYCWGGYVAAYAVGETAPFSVCVQLHPGFPSSEIAGKVSVPLLALCSKDEPESYYKDFKTALRVENRFEVFPEMVHGWLAARGDLAKPIVREQFNQGYQMVIKWMQGHL
ncbi:alpha/beta-hydrolase [Polychaeton citri CBS 116435]|uniref:Alpha/beta-hydrolase n=1 Tax=Polychaeton citri CBS 116435 TaxID=1314669 RepID=A0A9P4Q3F9_9PEZI|nr:alpha/beta-hydrolase [Polychaeton citri CBS 116435]